MNLAAELELLRVFQCSTGQVSPVTERLVNYSGPEMQGENG